MQAKKKKKKGQRERERESAPTFYKEEADQSVDCMTTLWCI